MFCANSIVAQSIDSLERALSIADNDIVRIQILNQLSGNLTFIDVGKALKYANQGLDLSIKNDHKAGMAYAYRNLSSIHSINGSFHATIDYIERSLDLFRLLGDSTGIANCYITLGHTYRRLADHKKELYYHKAAYEIHLRNSTKERIGVSSHNLGEAYFNIKNFEESKRFTDFAIHLNDSLKNYPVLSSCYKVAGLLELVNGNHDEAEAKFKKVLALSVSLGDNSQKFATIESLIQLGEIAKARKNTTKYLEYLKRAVEFSLGNNQWNYLQQVYTNLILQLASQNDMNSVNRYLKEYKIVSDSITKRQLRDRMNLIGSAIEVHRLEEEKQKLEVDNAIQEERVTLRNIFLVVISVLALILLMLMFKLNKANKQIQSTNTTLRHQGELIDQQREHLEKLNHTKDRFFSIVAHDLKSPLNSLSSFSRIVGGYGDKITKEEMIKMAAEIQKSINVTIKMADNLIAWARVQMNDHEFHPQQISINEIVREVYEVYQEVALNKGIELTIHGEEGLTSYGDRNQLMFIIRNLVNNAIKFTPTGGKVTVKAGYQSSDVVIEVIDSGVGIPKEIIAKLFSASQKQSTKDTEGESGTGLGLLLSYEFVKLNGGKIEVHSEVGKGSTFKIIFKKSTAYA